MERTDLLPQALGLCAAVAAVAPVWAESIQAAPQEMTPIVITGVAPEAPLIFTTDPKIPRQPVPASDGTEDLKKIPGV